MPKGKGETGLQCDDVEEAEEELAAEEFVEDMDDEDFGMKYSWSLYTRFGRLLS